MKELDRDEFTALLRRHFAHVRLFGQRVYPVSAIFPLDEAVSTAREYVIAREPGAAAFRSADASRKTARYFIAIASSDPIAGESGLETFLLDASEQLFEEQRRSEGAEAELRRHLASREAQVLEVERELQRLAQHIGTLEGDVAARHAQIQELQGDLAARQAQIQELQGDVAARHVQIQELERHLSVAGETIRALEAALEVTRTTLEARVQTLEATQRAMEATRTWRLHLRLERARARARRLLGPSGR